MEHDRFFSSQGRILAVDAPRQPRRVMNGSGVWAAHENKTSHLESEGFMGMLFHVIFQKTELHSAH